MYTFAELEYILYCTSNVCALFCHVNLAQMLKEESNQVAMVVVALITMASGKENEKKLGERIK